MSHSLHIRLFGGFELSLDGRSVPVLASGRLQSLIAWLVLHAGTAQSRQHLAGVFWPESSESQARTNLRQLLHNLRTSWPESKLFIDANAQRLQWRPDSHWTADILDFEAAASNSEFAVAAKFYRGDLLPGIYEEWIEPHRARLRRQYGALLETWVIALTEQREYSAAISHTEELLTLDPLNESAWRQLIAIHAAAGDRAAALGAFERCAQHLREELSVQPDAATRQLRDRIAAAAAAQPSADSSALIGRSIEWAHLMESWQTVSAGAARFVAVTGEAGIGKTRLVEELLAYAANQGASTARTACYATETTMSWAPVTDWLRSAPVRAGLNAVARGQLSHLARVLPEILADHPDVAAPGPFTESWQRRHFYEALATAILKARPPLVLAIDDLQWCDGETLEWLAWLIRFEPSARILVIATIRIEQVEKQQPVFAILRDLARTGQATDLPLGPLSLEETALLASRTARREFQAHASSDLHGRTRGNPLFIIETVRAGWTGSASNSGSNSGSKEDMVMPARIHAVIASRLAQLSDATHQLAGAAATIGRPFPSGLLAVIAGTNEEATAIALDELWERRILQADDHGAWDFTHGNLREVAYEEVGPARRQLLHRQTAEALEKFHAANPDAASLQIAGHFERAVQPERAIPWYERAAVAARRSYAEEEAIALLSKAVGLLEQLPQTPARDRAELCLLSVLGPAFSATRGYASPEVGRVSARARLLCELTGDVERTFPVLASSWGYHVVRGEFDAAREIALRYREHARRVQDPVRLAAGMLIEASPASHQGALRSTMDTFLAIRDRRLALDFQPFYELGPEVTVFAGGYLCHTFWFIGDSDRARIEAEQNIRFATDLSHPFSLALALAYTAMLHQFLDEPDAAESRADEAAALCRKHNFLYYLSWTPMIRGWARARKGFAAGLEEMSEGFADLRATGAQIRAPYYLSLLAEALREAGRPGEAAQLLQEAFLIGERNREFWIKPELERIQGDLLRDAGDSREAAVRYREAIRLAREQGSRAFELRAEKAALR